MELMVVVAILAIVSAIAIPAFIKHMRRARTAEAVSNIAKLYHSSVTYFVAPRAEEGTGIMLECQFPPTNPLTPDVETSHGCCGGPLDQNDDGRCDVNAALWDTPTWSALNFSMNDEHYFGYYARNVPHFSGGRLFAIVAIGDQDCDGHVSVHATGGIGYAKGVAGATECQVHTGSGFYTINETE